VYCQIACKDECRESRALPRQPTHELVFGLGVIPVHSVMVEEFYKGKRVL
jgi:hypothetical protein